MSRGGASAETLGAGVSQPIPLRVSMLRFSLLLGCVRQNTEKSTHIFKNLSLCISFHFLIWVLSTQPHVFTCVIRFHIHLLSFDKFSLQLSGFKWNVKIYLKNLRTCEWHLVFINLVSVCSAPCSDWKTKGCRDFLNIVVINDTFFYAQSKIKTL